MPWIQISTELTTNCAVLKYGEHNIQDTINQGQYSAEHLGLVMSHEIFSVYRHLKLEGMKTSLSGGNKTIEKRNLNEENHSSHDKQKCRNSVGDEFSITCLQGGVRLVVGRRHGYHHLHNLHRAVCPCGGGRAVLPWWLCWRWLTQHRPTSSAPHQIDCDGMSPGSRQSSTRWFQ